MIGIITAYSATVNMGYIKATNGRKYMFARRDWQEKGSPEISMSVIFATESDTAKNVSVTDTVGTNS